MTGTETGSGSETGIGVMLRAEMMALAGTTVAEVTDGGTTIVAVGAHLLPIQEIST